MAKKFLHQLSFGFPEDASVAVAVSLAGEEVVRPEAEISAKASVPSTCEEPAAVPEQPPAGQADGAAPVLLQMVRRAARAFGQEGEHAPGTDDSQWDYLLDDRGRLISTGRSESRLIDFILSSIGTVYEEHIDEGKRQSVLGDLFHRAADTLGRCCSCIDNLLCEAATLAPDDPIALRSLVQAAANGYTRAGQNAWNQLITEDGYFEAEADFDDLLATFVICQIGEGYDSYQPAAVQIGAAAGAMGTAQAQLQRVGSALMFDFAVA